MKIFKHLQQIAIKNPIFNVPLNIFLFNNLFLRFLNSYYLFMGLNFVQKFGPSYKNGVMYEIGYFISLKSSYFINIFLQIIFETWRTEVEPNVLQTLFFIDKT